MQQQTANPELRTCLELQPHDGEMIRQMQVNTSTGLGQGIYNYSKETPQFIRQCQILPDILLSPPDIFLLPEVVTVPKSIKIISCDEYDFPSKNDSQNFCKVQEKHLYSNIYPTRCNVTQFISSVNCSTCFGGYHNSSGTQTTVCTTSDICHSFTATCRYRGRVGTGLSVLWVAVVCAPNDG